MSRPPSTSPSTRRRRAVQYVLILIGCVLVADSLIGDNGLLAMFRARAEYRALEVSLAQARARNAALREEARRYREDPAAIEEAARRDLGMIKEGEKLFILRDVVPNGVPSRP